MPVVAGAGTSRSADEKSVSYLRKEFAATAERRGRPPRFAEAMVDADVEIIPPPSLPPLLPQPASGPARSPDPARPGNASPPEGSGSVPHQGRTQRPQSGDGVVQWLRPVRNLRRAIVVATILGSPAQL